MILVSEKIPGGIEIKNIKITGKGELRFDRALVIIKFNVRIQN